MVITWHVYCILSCLTDQLVKSIKKLLNYSMSLTGQKYCIIHYNNVNIWNLLKLFESCRKNWGRWESLKLKIELQWWGNYLITLTRMIKEENLLLLYKNLKDSLKICIYICKNVCCANVWSAISWKEFLTFCIPWIYQGLKEEKRDKYIINLEARICDILFTSKKVFYGIKKNGKPSLIYSI